MNLDDIEKRIAHIREVAPDFEAAHGREDELRADFIEYVSKHGPSPLREMAAAILTTDSIDFPRYCA